VVHDRQIVTLLGPSGSGKSTLLSIAAGITPPTSGQVLFRGEDVTHRPMHQRGVGMVFQRYTLFPNKTVSENVAFPLQVRRLPKQEIRDRVDHFLDLVSLSAQADRYPSEISGGQAQRVALARALVFEPSLLLMDEPLGALDRRLRQDLQVEIRRIQQATGVPTLYVTHDQEEAMSLSDRIIIVREGAITAEGLPRALYQEPSSLWAAAFLGDVNSRPVSSIHRCGDGLVEALTDLGDRITARGCGRSVEASSNHVVVRPEMCIVSEKPLQDVSNVFRGSVSDVSYLGMFQKVSVELESGWRIDAAAPGHGAVVEPGAQVYCGWDARSALIVAE
jgi:ABC-type Fe3+/spermidine/putrescine transport system ATPase subunit